MGCDIHKETAHSSFGRVSWWLRSSRIRVLCCILQTSWGGETERYLHCLNAWKGSALQDFPVNLEKRKNKQQGKHAGVFIEFNFTLQSEQQAYQSSYNLHSSKMTSDQSTGWLKAKFKKKKKNTHFFLVSFRTKMYVSHFWYTTLVWLLSESIYWMYSSNEVTSCTLHVIASNQREQRDFSCCWKLNAFQTIKLKNAVRFLIFFFSFSLPSTGLA